MPKSLLIIGGGVAGLAAGCYARMNGFDVEIHEMHNAPGGLCTAWTRQGYTFDLCIDWLCGSIPGTSLYPVWEELGLVQGRVFQDSEYYTVAFGEGGERFTVWTDPDRLREELIRLSPGDKRFIETFCRDIRRLEGLDMPVDPGILDLLRMLPYLGLFRKYAMPVSALAERIGDPSARGLFVSALDWHSQSAFFVMMMLGYMARKAAGYPIGGSVPLARALESRFLALGGSIKYGSKVAGIIIEDNRATGVILDDGTRISSDMVLSAADGHTTLFSWIPQRYVPEKIKAYYQDLELFPPLVFVSLGMKGTQTEIPRSASFPVREPATIAGIPVTRLFVRNHAHDPTLAPAGKTALSVMIETDYDYWAEIPYHSEQYRQEKDRIGSLVVDALEEFFPGTKEQVEVIDVATPHTFVRYTGNWRGSYEGWLWTAKTMNLRFPQVLPGLGSFYMAGQWVAPGGGLPGAALSARSAVAQLCKDEGRRFVTSKPSES